MNSLRAVETFKRKTVFGSFKIVDMSLCLPSPVSMSASFRETETNLRLKHSTPKNSNILYVIDVEEH